jgi:hypothetical protein
VWKARGREGTATELWTIREYLAGIVESAPASGSRPTPNTLSTSSDIGRASPYHGKTGSVTTPKDAPGSTLYDRRTRMKNDENVALSGTGMQFTGAGSCWLQTTAPVVPGETIRLDLVIFDVEDGSSDSVALFDAFGWDTTPVDGWPFTVPLPP